MKILAIDDNRDNLIALKAVVSDRIPEARFLASEDGFRGIEVARIEDPDVIILDIIMPGMDGYMTCQKIKEDSLLKEIPVLFLTALKTSQESRIEGLEAGAEGFLSSPVDEIELIAQIRAMCKIRNSNRHQRQEKEQLAILVDERTRELQKQLTEKLQVEKALRESEDRFKFFFESANVGKSIIALGGEMNSNRAFAEMLGYSLEELKGKSWRELTPEDEIKNVEKITGQLIAGEKDTVRFSKSYYHKNGSRIWADLNVAIRRDESGKPLYFCTTIVDVTEQRKTLEECNRLFEVIDRSLNEIYIFDAETLKFRYANRGALKNIQYSLQQIKELTPLDLKPEISEPGFRKLIQPLLGNERTSLVFETFHQRADKSIYPVEVHLQLVGDEQNREFLAVIFDTTERLKVESEREMLIAAIEQAKEMIIITDTNGIIQFVNSSFEQISGYSRAEVIGKSSKFLASGKQEKNFYENLWSTISSGGTWEGRMVDKRKDGSLFTVEGSISPVINSAGRIVNFVSVRHDITQQLKLEAQFQQAQKMESIGRLAGGVAHDFNNMLSVILGYTEMAMEQVSPTESMGACLEEIFAAANRSAQITRQLLAFARKQTISPKLFKLNETVESMLKMLRRLIGEDIELVWFPFQEPLTVKMDPSQLDQILANLCVNASDAISGIGKITIETTIATFDADYCADHPGSVKGDFVVLEVSDDGAGMDSETVERIFEPFFTTKILGQGTGLGLATVYGIVKQNDGFINVYSEPAAGTTFKVYLPRQLDHVIDEPDRGGEETPSGKGETILLVEDEISILKLGKRMLDGLGYNVLAASNPGEAIEIAHKHGSRINLLITDVVMPEMNGQELVSSLTSFISNLKVLFMSGYTANIIAARGVLEKNEHFIQKPFSRHDFAVKVRRILDQD